MKRTRKCTECGSGELYTTVVSAGSPNGPNFLPGVGSFWRGGGKFEVFVCRDCGLTQFYVPEQMLPDLKKKFRRFN